MEVQNDRRRSNSAGWAITAVALLGFVAMFGVLKVVPTYAQSRASGEVRGTVLDSTGAAIPGVAVTIHEPTHGRHYQAHQR